MLDEEIPEVPKPIVNYEYFSDPEKEEKDILDDHEENKLPTQFGKKKKGASQIKDKVDKHQRRAALVEEEEEEFGPVVPEKLKKKKERVQLSKAQLPISHVFDIKDEEGFATTKIDFDRQKNRFVTSNAAGQIKIWDFTSLDRKPKPIHTVQIVEDFGINAVSFSCTGGYILVCAGDCTPRIYSRDGFNEVNCLKGNNYVHDLVNTKGHTYAVTDGQFHPTDRHLFATAGRDSTVRVWDIYSRPMGIEGEIMNEKVLKAWSRDHFKHGIGSMSYSPQGSMLVAGVNDGTIQLWHDKKSNWKPDLVIEGHKKGSEISKVLFFDDSLRLASRATDDTLKIWDIRHTSTPLQSISNLPLFNCKTGVSLSPDESVIVTGTNVRTGYGYAGLYFYSVQTGELLEETLLCKQSIQDINWNGELNQIALSTSKGQMKFLYSPDQSKEGVLKAVYRQAKKKEIDDEALLKPVLIPTNELIFETPTFNRKELLERIMPANEEKQSVNYPPQGMAALHARPPSISQHLMKVVREKMFDEGDVRERLLSVKTDNKYTKAYEKTQPKAIFNKETPKEVEVVYYEQTKKKICRACGLKFCTCNKNIFQLPIPKKT